MKNYIILGITSILMIFVLCSCTLNTGKIIKNNNEYTGGITHLSYYNSNGMSFSYNYDITSNESGDFILRYQKGFGAQNDDPIEKELTQTNIQEISKIIDENNIKSRNGFKKYNKYVLDGTSRGISIYYGNGNEINANGYMERPKGYREGIDCITTYLDQILGIKKD